MQVPALDQPLEQMVAAAIEFAASQGIWAGGGCVVVVHGASELSADVQAVVSTQEMGQPQNLCMAKSFKV